MMLGFFICCSIILQAQNNYPEPEFSNEIYYLNKDSHALVRLEKATSKIDTKTKAGGFGGAESAYVMENERSNIRLTSGKDLSFVFSAEASGGMMDPTKMISLYKAAEGKETRKIIIQKSPGMFGGNKLQSRDKISFSTKKIHEGYWELVLDKPLAKGEYMFSTMDMGMSAMDGSVTLFAFAVE